jgi:hypothetical protein
LEDDVKDESHGRSMRIASNKSRINHLLKIITRSMVT